MDEEDISNTEINDVYKCTTCLHTFGTFGDLKRHMDTSHYKKYTEKKYFKCFHCGQKFYKLQHLQEHVKEFGKCLVTYVEIKYPVVDFQIQSFDNFLNIPNDIPDFDGEEDKKDFDLNLNTPEEEVEERADDLPIGGEETSIMMNMKKEEDEEEEEKEEEEEEPKTPPKRKRRTAKAEPKKVRVHCGKCDYSTHTEKLLKSHVRAIHDRIKPYRCSECGWTFTQATPLKNHIRAKHRGERPYSCNYCDYRATQKGPMVYHTKAKHTNDRSCICKDCSKAFPRNDVLKKHRLTKHGGV